MANNPAAAVVAVAQALAAAAAAAAPAASPGVAAGAASQLTQKDAAAGEFLQARRTARGLASHCTSPGFHKALGPVEQLEVPLSLP